MKDESYGNIFNDITLAVGEKTKIKLGLVNSVTLIYSGMISKDIFSITFLFEFSYKATLKIAKVEIAKIISQFLGFFIAILSIFIFQNFYIYIFSSMLANLAYLIISIILNTDFKIEKPKSSLLKTYIKLDLVFLYKTPRYLPQL